MDSKRQVNFSILFSLLKGKGIVFWMGIAFTVLPLIIFIPFTFALSSGLRKSYEKYDFKEIEKNGIEKTAKIISIESMNNVTINAEHPQRFSYQYENNGQYISDKFQTMDLAKTRDFSIGKEIKILFYKNETIIEGLNPFTFPFYIFYLIPLVFVVIGIPMLLIGLLPALKIFNLYKRGVIEDATVISINSGQGIFPLFGSRQNIVVNYYFFDEHQSKVYGESPSTDILLLMEKKAGDIIKIFVSEKDKTKSCVVPRYEAMKYNWSI